MRPPRAASCNPPKAPSEHASLVPPDLESAPLSSRTHKPVHPPIGRRPSRGRWRAGRGLGRRPPGGTPPTSASAPTITIIEAPVGLRTERFTLSEPFGHEGATGGAW